MNPLSLQLTSRLNRKSFENLAEEPPKLSPSNAIAVLIWEY